MLLRTERLTRSFGEEFLAVNNVTAGFEEGVLTSIIGPNGAGKTTFINLLTGSLKPDSGTIHFNGEEVTHLDIPERIKKGICRSFQITNIFPKLTVFQNVQIPVITQKNKSHKFLSWLHREGDVIEEVSRVLGDIGLSDHKDLPAAFLSHGDQRLLEVGIALATRPRIIFLDEPTQGMNKVEKTSIMEQVMRFSKEGRATFIIVEHDMDVVFSVSQRIIVMHSGSIIADGAPDEIKASSLVRQVYLGEEV